jgi:hypothetical protein
VLNWFNPSPELSSPVDPPKDPGLATHYSACSWPMIEVTFGFLSITLYINIIAWRQRVQDAKTVKQILYNILFVTETLTFISMFKEITMNAISAQFLNFVHYLLSSFFSCVNKHHIEKTLLVNLKHGRKLYKSCAVSF